MRLKHLLSITSCALLATSANAQLSDCNVFLKGAHVEVGINWNGAYGSSAVAPAGYHPNVGMSAVGLANATICGGGSGAGTGSLGFVADPAMDGWTTGTPAYFGDYFVPGTPQEGWSIMADGTEMDAWNQNDEINTDTTVVGSNVAYYDTDNHVIGVWQGMYDSIAIVQITTLDTSSLQFNVQVILTNLASTDRNNVYYMRTVDPDNEETLTGNFTTINTIEHQLPNPDNLVTVSATGPTYPAAYLALTTNDVRAKAFYLTYALAPSGETLDHIYDESAGYTYTAGSSDTLDVGIGIVFNIGTLHSVDSAGAVDSAYRTTSAIPNRAIINYGYNFMHSTGTTGLQNVNAAGVKVYPNPAKDVVNIAGLSASDKVKLTDLTGREVGTWQTRQNGAFTIEVGNLPAGLYMMQITNADGQPKMNTKVQKL